MDVLREYLSDSLDEPVVIDVDAVPLDFYHFFSAPEGHQYQPDVE